MLLGLNMSSRPSIADFTHSLAAAFTTDHHVVNLAETLTSPKDHVTPSHRPAQTRK
jgi:hypothetical protein